MTQPEPTPVVTAQQTGPANKAPEVEIDITELVESIRYQLRVNLDDLGLNAWTEQQVNVYKVRYPFVVDVWHGAEVLPGLTPSGGERRLISTVELYADYEGRHIALIAQVTDNEGNPMPDQQLALEQLVNRIADVEQISFRLRHPAVFIDEQIDRNLRMAPVESDMPGT